MSKRKRKSNAGWSRTTVDLPNNHAFEAQPGYKLMIASRGLLWLEYPADWDLAVRGDTFQIRDKPPPDDDCGLSVSLLPRPPIATTDRIPIEQFLVTSLGTSHELGPVTHADARQPDVEIACVESRWVEEGRAAVCRSALASGRAVLALLSFSYWRDDAVRCEPIWQSFLRTLQLNRKVDDPRSHILS